MTNDPANFVQQDLQCTLRVNEVVASSVNWTTASLIANSPFATAAHKQAFEERYQEYRQKYREARTYIRANGTRSHMKMLKGCRPPARSALEWIQQRLGLA